jgi:hypothetical protein
MKPDSIARQMSVVVVDKKNLDVGLILSAPSPPLWIHVSPAALQCDAVNALT